LILIDGQASIEVQWNRIINEVEKWRSIVLATFAEQRRIGSLKLQELLAADTGLNRRLSDRSRISC
jgi:hypothetical protein